MRALRSAGVAIATAVMVLVGAQDGAAASGPRFTAPVKVAGNVVVAGLVAADLNGDALADIAMGDYEDGRPSQLRVFLGRGDGTFRSSRSYDLAPAAVDTAAADMNRDGALDVVSVTERYVDGKPEQVVVLLNDGAGRFVQRYTHRIPRAQSEVAVGDVTGDGVPDAVTSDWRSLTVLAGAGDGRLAPGRRWAALPNARGGEIWDVELADIDGDAALDLAFLSGNSVTIRLNAGNGTFVAPWTYRRRRAAGLALADLNRDGRSDVTVTNGLAQSISVFLAAPDGTLGTEQLYPLRVAGEGPDNVAIADFDGDERLDLIPTGADGGTGRILLGRADGTFAASTRFPFNWAFIDNAVADFNGDDRPDVVFGPGPEMPYDLLVFLNWTGRGPTPCVVPDLRDDSVDYVRWKLRGTGCNPGRLTRRSSRSAPKGWVLAQRPAPGQILPRGTRVDLVVSSGRRRHRSPSDSLIRRSAIRSSRPAWSSSESRALRAQSWMPSSRNWSER